MAINTDINRYAELLSYVPEGVFYDREGIIVPYRSSPYELRFTTQTPNRKFGVFRNGVFQNTVQSDGVGNLVVAVQLEVGENVVLVVDSFTQKPLTAYLTARRYATYLAAYAAQFEAIDDRIDLIRQASVLAECPISDLPIVWGTRARFPLLTDWEPDTYRESLEALRQTQRVHACKLRGHEVAVEAVCQVPPTDFFRLFDGRRWILGFNFAENGTFSERTHSAVPTPTIPGIDLVFISPLGNVGAGSLSWNFVLGRVTYTDPFFGPFFVDLQPNLGGLYDIVGPGISAIFGGAAGPFAIVTGVNDQLLFNIERRGDILITLPAGLLTPVTVAATVNAALVADPRYGVTYGSVAQVAGGSQRVRFISVLTGPDATIDVLGVAQNAAPTVLGLALADLPRRYSGWEEVFAQVNITISELVAVNSTVPFTVYQAPVPNGWFIDAGTFSMAGSEPRHFAHTRTRLDVMTGVGNSFIMWREVDLAEVERYRGFDLRLTAWVQTQVVGVNCYLGLSFDGGITWVEGAPQVLTAQDDLVQLPEQVLTTLRFDPDATSLRMRIRLVAGAPGALIWLHELRLDQPQVTAAFLATATVPRSRHRSFFGHLLWAWSPEPLTAQEGAAVGLGTPPDWPVGQLDYIAPAHTQNDRFDVSEYDLPDLAPRNVKGTWSEADWATATLINLVLVPRFPTRFSHVVPIVAGEVTQTVIFSSSSPHLAPLTITSDQNLETSILLQDGVPLTQDVWSYTSGSQILLADPSYFATSTYELRYRAFYQATTGEIDLGPVWQDYLWFLDGCLHQRVEPTRADLDQEIVLRVDFSTFTATLDRQADPDPDSTRVFRDDGIEKVELSQDTWVWLSALTISFAGEAIKTGAIYTLTYREKGLLNAPAVTAVFELRSATTAAGLTAATYQVIPRGRAIKTHDGLRYHQARVTLTGVDDLRDVRLSSIVLKGLNMFGIGGTVPGLRY